jgi:hypothetical protein
LKHLDALSKELAALSKELARMRSNDTFVKLLKDALLESGQGVVR